MAAMALHDALHRSQSDPAAFEIFLQMKSFEYSKQLVVVLHIKTYSARFVQVLRQTFAWIEAQSRRPHEPKVDEIPSQNGSNRSEWPLVRK